ncbi:MAG: hypothetical protein DRH76_03210 [Deltaproteobacteria bacterium]|nr:MAG: hypothetical protein DRH76_03210 [Deltaproteobacteria bacterium]
MVGKEYERGGITKNGAKMLMVQSNLDVPKITLRYWVLRFPLHCTKGSAKRRMGCCGSDRRCGDGQWAMAAPMPVAAAGGLISPSAPGRGRRCPPCS